MTPATRAAAIFDLDRTLVRANTSLLYARWLRRQGRSSRRNLARSAWMMLQYTLGTLDFEVIARGVAAAMAGRDEREFRRQLEDWVRAEVLRHVSDGARRAVASAKVLGRPCMILTSTMTYVADPVAASLGIEHVVASRVEVAGGRFTGRHVPPACYGPHKVGMAEAWAAAHAVDLARSSFYSDSISDVPMLERVGEPYAVNPDPRLRWVAVRRGWPVLKW